MFHLLGAILSITLDVAEVAHSTDQAHIESPLGLVIYSYQRRRDFSDHKTLWLAFFAYSLFVSRHIFTAEFPVLAVFSGSNFSSASQRYHFIWSAIQNYGNAPRCEEFFAFVRWMLRHVARCCLPIRMRLPWIRLRQEAKHITDALR